MGLYFVEGRADDGSASDHSSKFFGSKDGQVNLHVLAGNPAERINEYPIAFECADGRLYSATIASRRVVLSSRDFCLVIIPLERVPSPMPMILMRESAAFYSSLFFLALPLSLSHSRGL